MKTATHVIPIVGMRCAGCAHTIEKKVLQIPGVEFASVNFASKKAFVRGEAALDLIIKAVESLGYQVNSNQIVSPEVQKKELARQKKETLGALLLSLPVFLLSMLHVLESWSGWVQLILSLPVLYLGRQFFKGAWKSLKHRRATMDSLVAIGTGTAFLYSCLSLYSDGPLLYFESSTVVLSLVLLGRTLEEIAKQQSSTALTELMTLTPQKVILITQKGNLALNEEISISQIKAGDLFLVRPAEESLPRMVKWLREFLRSKNLNLPAKVFLKRRGPEPKFTAEH